MNKLRRYELVLAIYPNKTGFAFVLFEETKPYVDRYGNHADVLGLFVGVAKYSGGDQAATQSVWLRFRRLGKTRV